MILPILLAAAACSGSSGAIAIESTQASFETQRGEVRHVAGRRDQRSLGGCEEAAVSVATGGAGDPIITTDLCQVCCGHEESEGTESRGRRIERLSPQGLEQLDPPRGTDDPSSITVTDVGPDGFALAVAGGSIYREAGGGWNEIAEVDAVAPASSAVSYFTDVAVGGAGEIYAAAGNGVARIEPSAARWIVTPVEPGATEVPLQDGAVVAPSPTDPILDITVDSLGRVVVVTELQVRRIDQDGQAEVLLDATTPATSPQARVEPRALEVEGGVSACCSGSTFYAATTSQQSGMIYVLEDDLGRVLRIAPDGSVTKAAGPAPDADGCSPQCGLDHRAFGPEGDEAAAPDGVSFLPETVSQHPSAMAMTADGDLLIALGAAGVVELGNVDDVTGS